MTVRPPITALALGGAMSASAQALTPTTRPAEHYDSQLGRHSFGLGQSGTTTSLMLDQFTDWLASQKFIARKGDQ